MRRMSFMLTERQFCDGSKDITRRVGWKFLKAGEHFLGVRKAMGLKKGEKQHVLGERVAKNVRRERLDAITQQDVIREGFPEMTPDGFVKMFCKHMKCKPSTTVTRIEFGRCDV